MKPYTPKSYTLNKTLSPTPLLQGVAFWAPKDIIKRESLSFTKGFRGLGFRV